MTFRFQKYALLIVFAFCLQACNSRLINVPGEKNRHSKETNLDVVVEADESVTGYQFRLVPENSPDSDCNINPGSYGPMLPKGTHLTKDFSSEPDGPLKLCVKLKAEITIENEGQPPQTGLYSIIRSASWIKDTAPPGSFDITGPSGVQTTNKPVISWSESDGAATYTLDIASDASCENVYRSYPDLGGSSFQITEGIPNGFWHICIRAIDLATNETEAANNGIIMTVDAPFHYAFVTSQAYSASQIGSISSADDQCTLHAFLGNLIPDWDGVSVVYKSILSDEFADAKNRLTLDRSIFNRNNQLVTFGSELWSGNLEGQSISYDESGFQVGSIPVWTGTGQDGLYSGSSCSNWSSDSGTAMTGLTNSVDSSWISDSLGDCSLTKHLYCIGPF